MSQTEPSIPPGEPLGMSINGSFFTKDKLRQAITVCIEMAKTYAIASDENGGGSRSINWESLDAVAAWADEVIQGPLLDGVNEWAKVENDFDTAANDAAPFTDEQAEKLRAWAKEGDLNSAAQLLATSDSPYERLNAAIAAERKKSDDTEGGTCD